MMTSFASAKVKGKTSADYRDDPSGVKGLAEIFSFFLRGTEAQPTVVSTQGVVVQKKTTTRYGGASRLSGPGTCRRGRDTRSGTPRQTRGTLPAPRLRWRRCAPATAWCWRTRASHGPPIRARGA